MAYVISNSEAKAIVVHSQFLPTIESVRNQFPALQAVIRFDDEAQGDGYDNIRAIFAQVQSEGKSVKHLTIPIKNDPCLFADGSHLAIEGQSLFTEELAKQIGQIF